MLRCIEVGIPIADLDLFEYGEILDLIIEKNNDSEKYDQVATQEDFDNFKRM